MQHFRLDSMVKGWFVGDFKPAAFKTEACEVALKYYRAGDNEVEHYHKVATEITLVVEGRVQMLGQEWINGDIIVLAPGEATAFRALTDVMTVVVKIPGATHDKFVTAT